MTLPPLRVEQDKHESNQAPGSWSSEGASGECGATTGFAARKLAPPKLHISSNKLKPLTEPYAELLSQLHKLVFAEQLPPSAGRDTRRRCIERYKRALFSSRLTPGELKSEVVKLARGSTENIAVDFGLQGERAADRYIAYADMWSMLEEVLKETRYYENQPY